MHAMLRTHIIIFADVPCDVVGKLSELERVVPVEGCIRVGGERPAGVFFFSFFVVVLVLPAGFLSGMYEKEKWNCSAQGRAI